MKFEYNGYILEIIEECRPNCFSTKCKEPNLSFNTLRVNITLENLIMEFKRRVDSLLIKSKEMTIDKNQDLILADQFSEAIDNLIEEILPLIDAKNLYYVINLKTKRVFEEFKDTVLYGCSFDELRENIISKIRVIKREEDKKKEYPVLTEFNKVLEGVKKSSLAYSMREVIEQLNSVHQLYGSVLKLSLDDVKKKYFELSSK